MERENSRERTMLREREKHRVTIYFFSLGSGMFGYKWSLNFKKMRESFWSIGTDWTVGETCCIYNYIYM